MKSFSERMLGSIWLFYAFLTVPLVWLTYEFFIVQSGGGKLFRWSGVFCVWLMLGTLAITPFVRMFRTAPWNRWLIVRRRHIGVAAFGYGLLHTVYWIQTKSLHDVLFSVFRPVALIGWLALAVLLAMAVTSNDWSVRRLGIRWKTLQRWIYIGAPLTLWHWFMAEEYRVKTIVIYGGVLVVLFGYRLWQRRSWNLE
ncbi:MAG: ferric reductase-like transmembrane domain-containing protein [Paracoccaceae bacterium]